MGKIYVVQGSNGSGKSAFAEQLICSISEKRIYAATMISRTPDNEERIVRHIERRSPYGFRTFEMPYSVRDIPDAEDSAVLLEDVSNLLANNIFEMHRDTGFVYDDIMRLSERCLALVLVTISGLEDDDYSGETAEYIHQLNRLNDDLIRAADTAVEMRNRRPVAIKDGENNADEILMDGNFNI